MHPLFPLPSRGALEWPRQRVTSHTDTGNDRNLTKLDVLDDMETIKVAGKY